MYRRLAAGSIDHFNAENKRLVQKVVCEWTGEYHIRLSLLCSVLLENLEACNGRIALVCSIYRLLLNQFARRAATAYGHALFAGSRQARHQQRYFAFLCDIVHRWLSKVSLPGRCHLAPLLLFGLRVSTLLCTTLFPRQGLECKCFPPAPSLANIMAGIYCAYCLPRQIELYADAPTSLSKEQRSKLEHHDSRYRGCHRYYPRRHSVCPPACCARHGYTAAYQDRKRLACIHRYINKPN